MGSAAIRKLLDETDSDDLELGSVVIRKEDRGFLRAVAALAPDEGAVEFFVRIRMDLGQERAKRVVEYLIDHPEVLEARRLQLVDLEE